MANSTYLSLTNQLLRRLNEGTLTSTDFASARSTQGTAKDAIMASIQEINAAEREWPFHYKTGSQVLVAGTMEYSFPTDLKTPDWESFYIEKDDTLGINTTPLEMIARDVWFKVHRPYDLDAGASGREAPYFIFDSSSGMARSFGVTPSPDAAYTVKYEYYAIGDVLSAHDDLTSIPPRYDWVIINGALKHLNSAKDNLDQTTYWAEEFNKGINAMRHDLIPKKDDMRSTMVNYGGNRWKSSTFGGLR